MTAAAPVLVVKLSQEMTPMLMEMMPEMQQKILALLSDTPAE